MRFDFDAEACRGWTLPLCALEAHDADERPLLAGAATGARARARRPAMARVAKRFSCSPDRVFAAWLDARTAGGWLFATATHPIADVQLDPRVGGVYRFVERRAFVTEYTGRYLEIVPTRRLAFTLAIDGGRESSVTIDIVPRRNGCELVLSQHPVASRERERTQGRWIGILYGLELMLDAQTHPGQTRS